jgi:hypothetical protein
MFTILTAAVGLLLLIFVVCRVPPWQLRRAGFRPGKDKPDDGIRLENELRTVLVQIIGGVAVLVGLCVAYQNLMTLQDGQITDRFTKAVEQLGNQDPSVRLGGIFSLERIARESERDHPAAMEILSAYVRAHSKDPSRRPDIGAAMLVIGRRRIERDGGSDGTTLHLEGVDLSKLDLTKGNYARISFVGAKFSDAILAGTQFDRADLTDSDLDRADLRRATFNDRAKLIRASLRRASLFHAVLRGADLSGAVLTEANLWHSDLTEADFTGAKLDGSFLLEADLRGAIFRGADLLRAKVSPQQLPFFSSQNPTNPPSPQPDAPRITGVLHPVTHMRVGRDSPAQPREWLELYCEGLGDLRWPGKAERTQYPYTVKAPEVMIGGEKASLDYWGIDPSYPAGYQVNFQFPEVPPGKHSLKLVVEGRSSEGFEIESGSPH